MVSKTRRVIKHGITNRLIQTTRSGVVTTYGYDGWGNLIQETVNGVTTEFVLDENAAYTRILGEVRSDGGERLYAYGPEGFSAQQAVGGGIEYPLLDGLGSVRQLINASGTVILTRSYDAYVNVRLAIGTGSSRLGYTGEVQDSVSGLVYLRARHYYPVLGRVAPQDSVDHVSPQWQTICQERRHLHEEVCWFLDPVQGGPAPFAEGLAATGTRVSLLFPTMYDDVAATNLAAGMTSCIRAELRLRVHLSTPLFGHKSVSENPLLFNSRYSAVLPCVQHH